jgi:hypothetical protein
VNDNPVADDDAYGVNEGGTLTVPAPRTRRRHDAGARPDSAGRRPGHASPSR